MHRRILRFWSAPILAIMMVIVATFPAMAATTDVQMQDTFAVTCSVGVRNIDGTVQTRVRTATLICADDTVVTKGVITNCTLAVPGYVTMAMTGYVGRGTNPYLSLVGTAGGDAIAIMTGRVHAHAGVVQSISGTISGMGTHSDGALGDDPAGAAATWSTAQSYNGTTSALLTQAAVAGSTYVQVTPPTGIKLSSLNDIVSGWSVAYDQSAVAYGPQIELRFQNPGAPDPDGVGHVDITLMPHQGVGTAAWVVADLADAAIPVVYYGNDPFNGTAISSATGAARLSTVEALINAEANMQNDGTIYTCGNWVLTRVRVELWEAGARTCYIDDLTIKGTVYTFEPVVFSGTFRALP